MTSISRKFLLGAGLLALSATAATALPAVVRSDLNLRSGPGTEYGIVGSMPAGATVDVGSCTGRWCVVAYGGEQGYAARSYLDMGAAGIPAVVDEGPYYSYAEPDYDYGDGYYYGGYGPGVTLGFGYYGDRRGHRWRHRHRDRDMANRGDGRPGPAGVARPSGSTAAIPPRGGSVTVGRSPDYQPRQSNIGGGGAPGFRSGASASGNATVGSGAPAVRSAPSAGRAGPSGGGAPAVVRPSQGR